LQVRIPIMVKPLLASLSQDVRYAVRSFRKAPGFVAAVVISIALGIAGNTTVFSMFNGLMLGSLPVREPDRLAAFNGGNSMSYLDYVDYRDQTKGVFDGVSAHLMVLPVSMGGNGEPERVWGQAASGNFFAVAGVQPALGRGFAPEEDEVSGRNPVVVLSDGLWKRRFGANAAIVGRTVVMNNRGFTVIGVAPVGFHGLDRILVPEFWIPLAMDRQMMPDLAKENLRASRNAQWLSINGRLKPGVSRQQAVAAVNVVKQRIDDTWRKDQKRKRPPITLTTAGGLPGEANQAAIGLMSVFLLVVFLVLLIACANVANLLLARATARQKEIGIRLALGAARGRLVRQLLTESILLAVTGAAGGYLLAWFAATAISKFEIPFPIPIVFNVRPDLRVFLFTAVLSVLTGVIFGLVPALRATRPDLVTSLKDEGAAIGSFRRFGLRNILVVVQVALSLILLVGSGLFLRSLQNASSIDIGMRPENVLLMAVDPKLHSYSPEKTRQFVAQIRERVSALPGVVSVTFLDSLPLSFGGTSFDFKTDAAQEGVKESNADVYYVGSRFFETMGIPVVRGRDFSLAADRQPVAIVNETMARKLFGGHNPVGRVITAHNKISYQVIGVSKDHKSRTLGERPAECAYLFLEQKPEEVMSFYGISIAIKSSSNPASLLRPVRNEIHALDANLAVFNGRTLQEHVNGSLLIPRLCASLLGVFGAVGLALATVGLYGVMAYSVRRRTRELGIRMALGADSGGVLRMVALQGLVLAGAGLVIGLAAAFALSRFAESLLYGVGVRDGFTFTAVPLLLLAVAFFAVLVPARRAARIHPMEALRYE
jgi:predicted permease